jgi:flagellar hook-associated protein 1 FlgK
MSLLSVGITGLNVSQTSLKVTGNNIANANNPAYSRQRVEIGTLPERFTGGGYIGNGASLEAISRLVDDILVKQIRLDTSSLNNLEVAGANLSQLDTLLADEFSSLGPAVDEFFAALSESSQNPSSEPARQVVLSKADNLAQTMSALTNRINQQSGTVNGQISSMTAQISSLAEGVAALNIKIANEVGRSGGDGEPNQLLDQREELLRQMYELVSISVVENNGFTDVFVGSGQPLVIGGNAASLGVERSQTNSSNLEVTFVDENGSSQVISSLLSGGQLGGYLEFREGLANDAINTLGLIAIGIAGSLNQQNSLGLDLDGNLGGNIFRDINDPTLLTQRVQINSNNSSPANQSMSVSITDITQLVASDYRLNVIDNDGSAPLDYQLIRLSDNSSTIINGVAGAQSIVVDGFSLDIPLSTQSNLALEDKFYISPTRGGSTDINVVMSRVQELAYAAPIVSDAAIGNTGDGLISAGRMLAIVDDADIALSPANPIYSSPGVLAGEVLIQFDSPTSYTVYENSNRTAPEILFTGTITPGQENSIFGNDIGDANFIGFQLEINGRPDAGDEYTISLNTNGSSDNRNAIALGALRNQDILDGGSSNFENTYGSLIERVGTTAAQAKISIEAAESLLQQSQANRDALSGVNLDEEAANLIKFEQTYNAAAQVINIARQLFDTLLSSLR